MMTANDFTELVNSVDFFYEFLEGNDYLEERNKFEQVRKISKQNAEFAKIFNDKFYEVFRR